MLANIEHLSRFHSPSITMMMRTVKRTLKRMIKYLIFWIKPSFVPETSKNSHQIFYPSSVSTPSGEGEAPSNSYS